MGVQSHQRKIWNFQIFNHILPVSVVNYRVVHSLHRFAMEIKLYCSDIYFILITNINISPIKKCRSKVIELIKKFRFIRTALEFFKARKQTIHKV